MALKLLHAFSLRITILTGFLSLFLSFSFSAGSTPSKMYQTMQPPVAHKDPKLIKIHGYEFADDYAWLRDDSRKNRSVLGYLKAENAYADSMTESLQGFREKLYRELLGRIKEDDTQVPVKKDGWWYYSRTEKGKQYPILCRKRESIDAPEEVFLDQNTLAKGSEFFSLGQYAISPDGNLLAYSTDVLGYRQYVLHVKDLRTGKVLERVSERVTAVVWAMDNRTLFYVQEDATTKRASALFRHVLGTAIHDTVYTETDELYSLDVSRTRSDAFIFAVSESRTTSEVRFIPAAQPDASPRLFLERKEGHEYYVDHLGSDFYVRTNDMGKNFRLVAAPVESASVEHWKELIPCRRDVMLEDVDCFATHYVTVERARGLPKLTVHDLATKHARELEFVEPVYVAAPQMNPDFHATTYRFSYESLITPGSVYDYDVVTHTRVLKKQRPVLGGYDSSRYVMERCYAKASDGTEIPISLVYRKGLVRDASNAVLLEAYGSYGISSDVDFSSDRLSLLDRGMVYALAHIRGGGDLGKEWHDQGKMMMKRNTFTDFIACAEELIAKKVTSPERLAITGGSAGGLLMGAVTNMRPELFGLVLSYVPFVDVINTMLDESLPLTVGEYLEWGNPHEKAAYDYMRSYSPYENLEPKAYPPMLIRTSLYDSQVGYWEPAKYVAKLRALRTDRRPLLFKTKLEPGGHGGASGRYDRLKDEAYDYAFMLRQFGLVQ